MGTLTSIRGAITANTAARKRLHRIGQVVALVATIVSIAALGSPAAAADSTSAPTTITFWNCFTTGELREGLLPVIEAFNRSQDRCRVEILDVPLIEDKLLMTVAGGAPPDVVMFDRFRIAQFAALGAFAPLEPLATRDGVRREDFFTAAWDECVFLGHLWGVPINTDVRVLFWNRTLFREAGLDRPPRDWDEMVEFSKKLTKPANSSAPLTQVGFVPTFGNTWLYLYGWQKGATFLDDAGDVKVNQPATLAALEWMKRTLDWYGVDRIKRFEGGFGNDALNPFVIGKLAMVGDEVSLTSAIRRYRPDLDYDVAPLPWPRDGVHATWSGGFSLVVPRGARNMEASWEFIKFMSGRDAQTSFGVRASALPANRLATDVPFYSSDPKWRVFVSEMEYSHYRPLSVAGSAVWDAMLRARDFVTYGVKAPKQALDDAQGEIDRALREAREAENYPLIDWTRTLWMVVPIVALLLAGRAIVSWRRYRANPFLRREARWGYLMAGPVIAGLLIFNLGPIVTSIILCFTWFDVLNPARAVGLMNFTRMFSGDELLGITIWNTLFFVVLAVPLGLCMALAAALLLNEPLRGRKFFRSVFFLPVVTPVIAASLLWMWLFNAEYGMLNALLTPIVQSAPAQALADGLSAVVRSLSFAVPGMAEFHLRLEAPNWLGDPNWSKPAIVIMSVWGFGQAMIIFLAGLQRIPRQLYEAATIDGADTLQKLRYVTIPMLSPTIFFNLVIGLIGSLQVFAQIFVMTYGGPVDSTMFYVLHLYRQAFVHLRMGYASALAWVLFMVILLLTLGQFKLARKWVHYD